MNLKIGDEFINPLAPESSPQRTGYFVRMGQKSKGVNKGKFYLFTDKNGHFWKVAASFVNSTFPASTDFVADSGTE